MTLRSALSVLVMLVCGLVAVACATLAFLTARDGWAVIWGFCFLACWAWISTHPVARESQGS